MEKDGPSIWTINNTSARILQKKFGADTKDWIGKRVPIEPARTEKGYAIYIDEKALGKLEAFI